MVRRNDLESIPGLAFAAGNVYVAAYRDLYKLIRQDVTLYKIKLRGGTTDWPLQNQSSIL
jgi:hypothetical protein